MRLFYCLSILTLLMSVDSPGNLLGGESQIDIMKKIKKSLSAVKNSLDDHSFKATCSYKYESFLVRAKDGVSLEEEYDLLVESKKNYARKGRMAKEEYDSEGYRIVYCINDKYNFGLTKPLSNGEYSLIWITENKASATTNQIEKKTVDMKVSSALDSIIPFYHIHGKYLWDILELPSFKLLKAENRLYEGTNLYRVEFSCDIVDSGKTRTFYCLLDPNRSCAIKEHGVYRSDKTGRIFMKSIIETTMSTNGSICPLRVEFTKYLPDNDALLISSMGTSEYVLEDKLPSSQEFYLSHYGLPEPNFEEPFLSTWMKYLLAGLVCLGIAYWIKRRRAIV